MQLRNSAATKDPLGERRFRRSSPEMAFGCTALSGTVVKRLAKSYEPLRAMGPAALWKELLPVVPSPDETALLRGTLQPSLFPIEYNNRTRVVAGLSVRNPQLMDVGNQVYGTLNGIIRHYPDQPVQTPHIHLGYVPFGLPMELEAPVLQIMTDATPPDMVVVFSPQPVVPEKIS